MFMLFIHSTKKQTVGAQSVPREMGAETNSVNSSREDSGVKNVNRNVPGHREAGNIVENLRDPFKEFELYPATAFYSLN